MIAIVIVSLPDLYGFVVICVEVGGQSSVDAQLITRQSQVRILSPLLESAGSEQTLPAG